MKEKCPGLPQDPISLICLISSFPFSLSLSLSVLQRRAMDRASKVKKVGSRYYETHNVKNKNKNKKTPAPATEGRKAKRTKR